MELSDKIDKYFDQPSKDRIHVTYGKNWMIYRSLFTYS